MEVVTVIGTTKSKKRIRTKEEEELPIREGVPVCGEEAAALPPLALAQAGGRLRVRPCLCQH